MRTIVSIKTTLVASILLAMAFVTAAPVATAHSEYADCNGFESPPPLYVGVGACTYCARTEYTPGHHHCTEWSDRSEICAWTGTGAGTGGRYCVPGT